LLCGNYLGCWSQLLGNDLAWDLPHLVIWGTAFAALGRVGKGCL
jgi:hypothetical protein